MTVLRIERHELGPRVHVGPWRVHHFASGAALAAIGAARHDRALVAFGAWLCWDDRHDLAGLWHQPAPVLLAAWDPEIGVTTGHGPW